jgi:hypothetical protein
MPQEVSETVHMHTSSSGLPSFQALHQIRASLQGYKNATYMKNLIYTSRLILKRITEAAETISQQPGIFEHTAASAVYRGQWPYI